MKVLSKVRRPGEDDSPAAGHPGAESLLSVDELTVSYGHVLALRTVSLSVARGELVSLVGPIGAGKTTLMTTVMGLNRAASGRICFAGREIGRRAPEEMVRRGLSLVPERRRIFPALTVWENLRLGATVHRGRLDSSWDEVFDLFPILQSRRNQVAGFLSGGEAQQLAIARALASRPELLLLDEPSLGLAPKLAAGVFELLQTLRAEHGLTILLVEQNAFKALEIADRGYVLRNGVVEASGPAAELLRGRDLVASYLGVAERGGEDG